MQRLKVNNAGKFAGCRYSYVAVEFRISPSAIYIPLGTLRRLFKFGDILGEHDIASDVRGLAGDRVHDWQIGGSACCRKMALVQIFNLAPLKEWGVYRLLKLEMEMAT